MSDFKAKMHKIRLPLGLCLRPRWGLTALPRLPAVFKGATSKGREGKEGKEEGGEGNGEEKGEKGKGEKEKGPKYVALGAAPDAT